MREIRVALVAAALAVLGLTGVVFGVQLEATPPAEVMPESIASILGAKRPAWTAARATAGPGGELQLDRLPEEARFRIETIRSRRGPAESKACLELGPIITDLRPGTVLPQEFDDLVKNSLAILRGRVVGMEPGFFNTEAGLLLKVKIQDRLKSSDRFWNGPHVFVYYPRGDFRVGSTSICKRDPRWPVVPDLGDELLLFPHVSPIDPEGNTMDTDTSNFEVVLEHAGGLVPPDRLRRDPVFQAFDTVEALASYTDRRIQEDVGR